MTEPTENIPVYGLEYCPGERFVFQYEKDGYRYFREHKGMRDIREDILQADPNHFIYPHEPKHTPLPWVADFTYEREPETGGWEIPVQRGLFVLMWVYGSTKEEAEANAALIVKAVNNHEKLVEALTHSTQIINALIESKRVVNLDESLAYFQTVIKEVEGGEG